MYVYIDIDIYICMRVCIFMHIYTCMYIYIYVCVCVRVCLCVCVRIRAREGARFAASNTDGGDECYVLLECMYTHMYVYTYKYIYKYIYIYIYIYICTNICITQTQMDGMNEMLILKVCVCRVDPKYAFGPQADTQSAT